MGVFDDEGNEIQDTSPGGLRAALEKANRAAAEAQKELEAERARSAELTKQTRSVTVEKLLGQYTDDASRFAQYVPADVELNEAAVAKWVEDNKSVYAFKPVAGKPAEQSQQTSEEKSSVNPLEGIDMNLVDQLVRMGVLGDRSQAISGTERMQLTETTSLAKPKSLDDAKEILAGLGIEVQDTGGYSDAYFTPRSS